MAADLDTAGLIAAMIGQDMTDLTERIHMVWATTEPIMYEPPGSAPELPPVMAPEWNTWALSWARAR